MPILRSCADNCNEFASGLTSKRWRRNGKTRYWKREPDKFVVPVKHGMYNYDHITQDTPGVWCAEHGDKESSAT